MLRLSTLFLRTLRDDPADAEVPSHRLLVRAGYIRRVAPGIYAMLPLGVLLQRQIERVVREEMDAIGAQEVHFPALLPREPYEATGRWDEYGDTLFRLQDRRGVDHLLGPTHEELFTLTVKGEYSSYKDFPVTLYQIQTKYRDEARPRSGLLRGREFVMKDSYSFDLDDAGLQTSYDRHRAAYVRIFERLGISFRVVSAVSGAMGGSASEEFLAPSAVGEDTFVACSGCDYAANVEAAEVATPAIGGSGETGASAVSGGTAEPPPMQVLHTPDAPGITALVAYLGAHHGMALHAGQLLKNILFKVDDRPVMVLVPGDREVDEERLAAAVAPAALAPFEDADFAAHPHLVRGYVSAIDMARHGVDVLADPRVAPGTAWVTGANRFEHHVVGVVVGRDFTVDRYVAGVATVAAGDPCPRCGAALELDRAIEIGHIFQLGRKYADAFELDALGPDGRPVRITMGSYGIGVTRAMAVIAEQRHDELGLCWPAEVAPAHVHVVAAGKGAQQEAASRLAGELEAAGARVLLDDRANVSAGVKFRDAELLGMPYVIVVGRGLADGVVELRRRADATVATVPIEHVAGEVLALLPR
ncbi:MAG: proline--tRNA ligase [Acidimicrobiia bacterium]